MNSGKEDLFQLIKSMSKSEKRYFKMESKKAGDKTSNHIKLFDAINKMEDYDEDFLKKRLKKETFIKHLSAEKRYLYQAVLKSIRNFKGDQSIYAQIKTMVVDANYLLERALYDQAEKILDKAAKLAEKIDDTVSLLEINLKRQEFSRSFKKKDHKLEIESLMKEKNEIIDVLLTKLEIRDVYNKIGSVKYEDNHRQILDFMNGKELLLDKVQHLNSFYAKSWRYGIMVNYFISLGNLEKVAEVRSNMVLLWNQNPDIKEEFHYKYLVDIANIIASSFSLNQMELAFKYLTILENEKAKNSYERVFIFEKTAIKKLIYSMSKGDFDKALLLVPAIESGLGKNPISESSRITIKLNIAILFFCIEDFYSCLSWSNKIINISKSKVRIDIQRFVRLLAIIAQIETDEKYEVIDNFFRSTRRFFIKNAVNKNSQSELILLDFLWKYLTESENQRITILNQFKLKIEEFRNHSTKKLILGLEEIHFWIRSKLEKRPIDQLIKESNGSGV